MEASVQAILFLSIPTKKLPKREGFWVKLKRGCHDKNASLRQLNNALYQDIRGINGDISQFNTLTTLTQPQENHFGKIVTLSATDMEKLKVCTEGG